MTYVGGIVVAAGLYIYVGRAIEENNRRTCDLYSLVYQPQPDTPMPEPGSRGDDVRKELKKLLDYYECEY